MFRELVGASITDLKKGELKKVVPKKLPCLEQRLVDIIDQVRPHCSDPACPKLLLAVSGGKDSVVLFDVCQRLSRNLPLRLGVAHVDHKVRPESGADAQAVKSIVAGAHVPFFLLDCTPLPLGVNQEAWLRRERYRLLGALREREGFDWIVTGHTASDVIETFLMRTLANREPRSIVEIGWERRLLRPFLGHYRRDIEAYHALQDLPLVEDASNLDLRFTRNLIRHKVLPSLVEQLGPQVVTALYHRALASAQDTILLEDLLQPHCDACAQFALGSQQWRQAVCGTLRRLPHRAHWCFIELLLRPVVKFNLGRKHGARVAEFFTRGSKQVEIPGKMTIRRNEGRIEFIDSSAPRGLSV